MKNKKEGVIIYTTSGADVKNKKGSIIMKVRGFVGLVGSVAVSVRNGKNIATFLKGRKGDIQFEVERGGCIQTVSLTQAQLKEAVEYWLYDREEQSAVYYLKY